MLDCPLQSSICVLDGSYNTQALHSPLEWIPRKLENHAAAAALNYFAYNFIKIHRTLRTSPAMAAGVTDRLWSVVELAALWEAYERRESGKSGVRVLKKTELRDAAYGWIEGLPHGSYFDHTDTYQFLEMNFPDECSQRGDAVAEPRYKNDARWAVQDALGKTPGKNKIIEQVGHARFRRL